VLAAAFGGYELRVGHLLPVDPEVKIHTLSKEGEGLAKVVRWEWFQSRNIKVVVTQSRDITASKTISDMFLLREVPNLPKVPKRNP